MKLLFNSDPPDVFYPNTLENLTDLVLKLDERVKELQNRVSELGETIEKLTINKSIFSMFLAI